MKKCPQCEVNKDYAEFGSYKSNRGRISDWCKSCVSEYGKVCRNRSLMKNKDYDKIRGKKATIIRKKVVVDAYGGKCACCSEEEINFLCVDHVNGGGTEERKSGLRGTAFYLYLIKNNFPSGYRILCQNCNFSIGVYGHCPHTTVK